MPLNRSHPGSWILGLLALISPVGAIADVTVLEHMSLSTGTLKAQVSSKQSTAGDRQRTEFELRCEETSPAACHSEQRSDITRLDRDAAWSIEPTRRVYTETLFKTAEQRRAATARMAATNQNACPRSQPAVDLDTSKCELSDAKWSVEKTDELASFAGYAAQLTQIKLTQSCVSSDPKQACELVYTYDAWLSRDEVPALDDRRSFQRRYFAVLGLADSSPSIAPPFAPYVARYASSLSQLSQKAGELKGYPLKTDFRMTFSGAPCGAHQDSGGHLPDALSGAGKAAAQSTSNSVEHAAGWGTADAVERYSGSSVGSYVAGNAAGSFAGSLVGGLFAKKARPTEAKAAAAANNQPPATTLVELSVEIQSVNAEVIPASQFEVPSGWTKIIADRRGEPSLPSCQSASRGGQ